MATRDTIEQALFGEVKKAHQRFEIESANFESVACADGHNHVHFPENLAKFSEAAKAYNEALELYGLALKRAREYVANRIVPDDLQSSGANVVEQVSSTTPGRAVNPSLCCCECGRKANLSVCP